MSFNVYIYSQLPSNTKQPQHSLLLVPFSAITFPRTNMTTEPSITATLSWKTRLSQSLLTVVTDLARRSDGTINRRLLGFFESTAKVRPQTSNGVQVSDITIDSTRNLWFRLFIPTATNTKLPVLVFFHGGGFTYFSPDLKEYDALGRRFARETQSIVVSVNYRLAPEHKYPSQIEDGLDALKFLDNMSKFTGDLSRCFLVGDSAGGNIAHHLACKVSRNENQFKRVKVIGLVVMQGFFGGEERTESEIRLKKAPFVSIEKTDWHWKALLPEGEDRDHEAVNVFGPKSGGISDLNVFPPVLVFVGGFDPLQDWQKRYYEELKKSGKKTRLIEYRDAIHAFYVFPDLPQASLLMTEMAEFIATDGEIKS